MTLRIDPVNAMWRDQFILAQYIKDNLDQVLIKKSGATPYKVNKKNADSKEFFLEKSILRRARKPGKSGYRYEVVDDEILGEGNAGVIHPSLATLVLGEQYLHPTKKQKKRVIKVQDLNEEQGEATISQQAAHLHAKEATLDSGKAYTVIKRMPGKDLREIFVREKLSTEQKLQLLLALFKAWQSQVFDNGLVHRDIKPENIMVNFISGNPSPEINIIDFGFAKKSGDESDELAGTPLYIPPEILEWVSNPGAYDTYPCLPAMDIYALSKLACELFSENYSFSAQQERSLRNVVAKLLDGGLLEEEIKWLAEFGVNDLSLEKVSDLSDEHKRRLLKIIQKMSHFYPNQRPTIEQVIEELSIICQERVLPAKLNYLKQYYPVYQILSSYPQLFTINKTCIESDEKKINRYSQALLTGKADLGLIEKEVNQITKAWQAIKKSNASPIFNDIFKILSRCLVTQAEENKSTQNEFEAKVRRKIVTYIKTHMKDMLTKQDIYASKRLTAMSNLLNDLENSSLRKPQLSWEKNLTRILSHQFDGSLSRPLVNQPSPMLGFFTRKQHDLRVKASNYGSAERDSGIESGASSNSLSP